MKLIDIIEQLIINNYIQFWTKLISSFWENGQKPSEQSKKRCFSFLKKAFEKSLKRHMKQNIDLWHGGECL